MHRIGPLPLLFAGIAVVALALLLRVDLRRAARTGPRWRRRLIGAGLAALVATGLVPPAVASTGSAVERLRVLCGGDEDLAGTVEWQEIEATWTEAGEVGSGKRGDYPFDEAGKKKLLEDLDRLDARIGALLARGLLSRPEADLLRQDRAELVAVVRSKRPTEMQDATCYKPMALPAPAERSAADLAARLPLLDQLLKEGNLHPAAVRKVLASIEADLVVLASEEEMERIPAEEREAAEKARDGVKADVEAIQKLLNEAK